MTWELAPDPAFKIFSGHRKKNPQEEIRCHLPSDPSSGGGWFGMAAGIFFLQICMSKVQKGEQTINEFAAWLPWANGK